MSLDIDTFLLDRIRFEVEFVTSRKSPRFSNQKSFFQFKKSEEDVTLTEIMLE